MERAYSDGEKKDVKLFIGYEVEKTPAFEMKTLFVVGLQDPDKLQKIATENNLRHVYFGANMSFDPDGMSDWTTWEAWEKMIKPLLEAGYWCTLDLDAKDVEGLLESFLAEYRRFIPMISVKVPMVQFLGYNATIKIDDSGFDKSNPGVWCHQLNTLTTRQAFTSWDEYTKDESVE